MKQLVFSIFLTSILSLSISTDTSCSKILKSARQNALVRIAEARRSESFRENCTYLTAGAGTAVLLTAIDDGIGLYFGLQAFLISVACCAGASRLRAEMDPIKNLHNISETLTLQRQNKLLRSRYILNSNAFLKAARACHIDEPRPYAAAFKSLSKMKKELIQAKLVLKEMPKYTKPNETEVLDEAKIKKNQIAKQEKRIDSLLNILYSNEQAKNEIDKEDQATIQMQLLSKHDTKRSAEVAQRA